MRLVIVNGEPREVAAATLAARCNALELGKARSRQR